MRPVDLLRKEVRTLFGDMFLISVCDFENDV